MITPRMRRRRRLLDTYVRVELEERGLLPRSAGDDHGRCSEEREAGPDRVGPCEDALEDAGEESLEDAREEALEDGRKEADEQA